MSPTLNTTCTSLLLLIYTSFHSSTNIIFCVVWQIFFVAISMISEIENFLTPFLNLKNLRISSTPWAVCLPYWRGFNAKNAMACLVQTFACISKIEIILLTRNFVNHLIKCFNCSRSHFAPTPINTYCNPRLFLFYISTNQLPDIIVLEILSRWICYSFIK